MIKLSIITPYYNTPKETRKLIECLDKQLNDSVEWIIIDDGCENIDLDNSKAKVIHLEENKGVSYARNIGIKESVGEYIVFIDSDDLVSEDYINSILNKIDTSEFDYCYFSWRTLQNNLKVKITDTPPSWNWAIWNAIYKRDYVELFDEDMKNLEDVPWQNIMRSKNGKKEILDKVIYYYNAGRVNSLTDIANRK